MQKKKRKKIRAIQVYKGASMLKAWDTEKEEEGMIQGDFEDIYVGDELYVFGDYTRTPKWGEVFSAHYYREINTDFWYAKWLKLSYHHEDQEIIELLTDNKGNDSIEKNLKKLVRIRKLLNFLQQQGVRHQTLAEIEKTFKRDWDGLYRDAYQLLQFKELTLEQVEGLITHLLLPVHLPSKAYYLTIHYLKKANGQGHYFLPQKEIKKKLERAGLSIEHLSARDQIVKLDDRYYLKEHYETETTIANKIRERISAHKDEVQGDISRVEKWEQEQGFSLAPNQKKAVLMALSQSFCIVTGGPGVGKTTVCKCITDLLGSEHDIVMVAPTGRAAKRANESTGLPAATCHSILEYNGSIFHRNEENPIEGSVLVIDESSMIDAPLLLALLKATPSDMKIIFVGDVDQLPSVGPGQILKDLIESDQVPVTKLTDIFRQAAGSPIISLAYNVNKGKAPDFLPHEQLHYVEVETEEEAFERTLERAIELYKKEDLYDVQLLVPMYGGDVGIDRLNARLQRALNPDEKGVRVGSFLLKKGDKVIQTQNDKPKNVYNGDMGIVTSCHEYEISVLFQGKEEPIRYSKNDFRKLYLAYAVTVHRSQGSEYKYVIIPTVNSYSNMLQKNLLYTAITRTKDTLWMIYQRDALESAVRLESVPPRYTSLKDLLIS
ncbi:AAA family ATPase (plasmid) [Pontibacillus sp. ALD_SL1]|uniref:SF1B family DNA helicase RecD2 n=1 Tax=Pontibacillus sp. ALD_SL1 TaxID=2777185 RepID=UPI001A966989|nr:AAA family ATPase [Pontibacillus sp. ALD_SL1]QST02902.1 AAA family ATPase [Pontibacillus sp. ALD_SL1]